MLNRETATGLSLTAHQLIRSPKFQNSRTLRRFLGNSLDSGLALQCFAFEEGYSAEQLEAIRAYAEEKARQLQKEIEALGFFFIGTQVDDGFGLVQNAYQLPFKVQTASLKQLQAAVNLVALLAVGLEPFARNPAHEAGFDDYRYRNLPCSIESEGNLWVVGGHDKRTGGSGVLEWCYDEQDAQFILQQMSRFPERFIGIKAERHQEGPGMHWAVEQAMGLSAQRSAC
jgi:hypothetical protein